MQKYSIEAIAKQQIDQARNSAAARAATTVYVLSGRVTLATEGESWEGRAGDLIVIPHARHTLTAEEDSAVLLTAVPGNQAGLRYMRASVTHLPIPR